MLEASPGRNRRIIVLTDGFTDPARTLTTAAQLHRQDIAVDIIGVGTNTGAPEPDGNGGFVRDGRGQVVLARLDTALLKRVAAAGGGRFVPLSALPELIADLHDTGSREIGSGVAAPHVQLSSWLNDGVWLLPPLLLLAALIARRGWRMKAVTAPAARSGQLCWASLMPQPALASAAATVWSDLWSRPDQQGQALLDAGQSTQAADRFHDPRRRAYADLQAGRYQDAAKLLAPFTDAQSEYNRGNALAKAGQLQAALAAYDAALQQTPADADTRHNRDLVAACASPTASIP